MKKNFGVNSKVVKEFTFSDLKKEMEGYEEKTKIIMEKFHNSISMNMKLKEKSYN